MKLEQVRWSDNLCTVGWSSIWAFGWDYESIEEALSYCPHGRFTVTTYVDIDARRAWTDSQQKEREKFGAPVYLLYKGAYFNFPLDFGALQLMQAVGLIDECMVMAAGGGRFPFPEHGWKRGGRPDVRLRISESDDR